MRSFYRFASIFLSLLLITAPAAGEAFAGSVKTAGNEIGDAAVSEFDRSDEAEVSDSDPDKSIPEGYILSDDSIGAPAKSSCKALRAGSRQLALLTEGNPTVDLTDGVLTISGTGELGPYDSREDIPWYNNSAEVTKVVIEEGITNVPDKAFAQFTKLTSVSIPSSVETIGDGAFFQCTILSNVDFAAGSKLKTVKAGAFCNCSSLTSLSIPDTVTELGNYFIQGVPIDSYTIPAGVTGDLSFTFLYSNIKAINASPDNQEYSSADGVLYTKDGKELVFYPAYRPDTAFRIPDGVNKVGRNAVMNTVYLETVDFNQVTTLGECAFALSSLKHVEIPDTVTELDAEYMTFSECPKLESISFGNGIKTIGYRVCYKCTELKEVDFGSAEEIGQAAFAGTGIVNLTLPDTVKLVGVASFAECEQLETIEAKGLETVAYQAFSTCLALKDVSLNEGVQTIYGYAFTNCFKLEAVTIPSTCTFVHETAFERNAEPVVVTNLNQDMREYGRTGYVDTLTMKSKKCYDEAYKVLDLMNAERQKEGLAALPMNKLLLDDAMLRASETTVFFSHCRTNGDSVVGTYSFISFYPGLNIVQGENIACGQSDAAGTMNSWMNSEGHRANILDDQWTSVGIGCVEYKGVRYWVQCFTTKEGGDTFTKPADVEETVQIHIEKDVFEDPTAGYKEIKFEFELNAPESIMPGKSTVLGLSLNGVDFDPESVDWSCSNESIATVSSSGELKALKEGIVTITASSRGYERVTKTIEISNNADDESGSGDGSGDGSGSGDGPGSGDGESGSSDGSGSGKQYGGSGSKDGSKSKDGSGGSSDDAGDETVEVGGTYKVGGQSYKVTAVASGSSQGSVSFVKARNAGKVTVPATVVLADGNTYKVTTVSGRAFTGKKIRTVIIGKNVKKLARKAFARSGVVKLIVKTKLLKKATVKGSLKGSKVRTIQVKVGSKKVNKKFVKKYKKIFTKKNAGKKVRIK